MKKETAFLSVVDTRPFQLTEEPKMETVVLMGAEGVERAGYRMSSAAESMKQTASYIESTFQQHQRFMDDWLNRLEVIIRQAKEE